ncbi:MAG: flagellar basal body rod protein FlgC [Thermodesulfobacteria bacterium]|nr:flagellar basal body rod protein FlgC [Thermodesulfobacteriota bacterium]
MNLFSSFTISAKGLRAERTRLNVASMNLANAHVTRTLDGGPYKAKSVVFRAVPLTDDARGLSGDGDDFEARLERALESVEVAEIVDDKTPFMEVYDPGHPDADENGMVKLPNVNVMEEMVDIMSAQRAYEANISAMDSAKNMAIKAIDIIR